MAHVSFTSNLQRHVATPSADVPGTTVRAVLEGYFRAHPQVRGYVLDDQGELHRHVAVFHNNELIRDRVGLTDAVGERDDLYVAQALSGG